MAEEWKDIEGFEGYYQVSNHGRVKSLERIVNSRKKTRIVRERILKQTPNPKGYLLVKLYKNNKVKTQKVHRLVAEAFIPNPEGKPEVNHFDGDKTNNKVSNLYWATPKENTDHAVASGLRIAPKGEKHGKSKLKEEEVKQIIYTIKNTNTSYAQIGRYYEVHPSQIQNINKGENWNFVLPEIQRPLRPVKKQETSKIKVAS